jgi:erythritol transport system ATP-binding protein
MTHAPKAHYALEARGLHKRYGGVHALRGVDFALKAGEVHALIGANGAGKSTLCKIIAGVEAPSEGELLVDGAPTRFASVRDAAAAGIDLVHQELMQFPDLTVVENLFLGRELTDRFGAIDTRAQKAAATKALARLGQALDPDTRLRELPVGVRQVVEIAKSLIGDTRVVVMDEPTSALSPAEIPVLFGVIRSLASLGVAIVYISHRLDELLEIADRVTVLRDGEIVAQSPCRDIDKDWIVRQMTGRAELAGGAAAPTISGAPLLTVSKLRLAQREGRSAVRGVDLSVCPGEVVGFYGLMGAGRTELFEVLLGLHKDAEGQVSLDGRDLESMSVNARIAAGLALMPEDRQRDGLLPNLSILRNMSLSSLQDLLPRWWGRSAERPAAQALVDTLKIKIPSLEHSVQALSGGNQQKVVLARCLMAGPKVLLLDEPTRGVDVAAKAEILGQMRRLASGGAAVLFASSDIGEILSASTRVVVMSRGRVTLQADASAVNETMLTQAAGAELDSSQAGLAA